MGRAGPTHCECPRRGCRTSSLADAAWPTSTPAWSPWGPAHQYTEGNNVAELTEDERHLIAWAHGLATAAQSNAAHDPAAANWRYHSVGELLLDLGRLFTPQVLPAAELGEMGRCYLNATLYATDHPAVFYTEGL